MKVNKAKEGKMTINQIRFARMKAQPQGYTFFDGVARFISNSALSLIIVGCAIVAGACAGLLGW